MDYGDSLLMDYGITVTVYLIPDFGFGPGLRGQFKARLTKKAGGAVPSLRDQYRLASIGDNKNMAASGALFKTQQGGGR